MKKVLPVCLITSALAVFVYAKKFWEEKPYTEWTQEEAGQLFARSPWAREDSVTLLTDRPFDQQRENLPAPSPSGDPSDPTSSPPQPQRRQLDPAMQGHPVRIVWVSELVRKAQVRLHQLQGQAFGPDEANQFIAGDPQVIQFLVEGPVLRELIRRNPQDIQEKTYLKKKDRQIPVSRVTVNRESQVPNLLLTFPSRLDDKPAVSLEDKDVELVITIAGRKLNARYKLKDMVVNGELKI